MGMTVIVTGEIGRTDIRDNGDDVLSCSKCGGQLEPGNRVVAELGHSTSDQWFYLYHEHCWQLPKPVELDPAYRIL